MLNKKIAIIGATGQAGSTLLKILQENKFPAELITLVASSASKGKRVFYGDQILIVEALAEFDFSKVCYAFFAVGSEIAKQYAPQAVEKGCYVIDKSSYYRLDPQVPLIVPEVNGTILKQSNSKIIAAPNCSTTPLVVALKPLHDLYGIDRVDVATYQAVSGAGYAGMQELADQIAAYSQQQDLPLPQKFVAPIAFNVVPMIDQMLSSGYTKEEMKMHDETCKILNDQALVVNATAVRVPVWTGHSEAVTVKTHKDFEVNDIIQAWQKMPTLKLLEQDIGTPLTHAANNNDVWLCRVRRHPCDPQNSITFWLMTDNLRKGAAYNAWDIANLIDQI